MKKLDTKIDDTEIQTEISGETVTIGDETLEIIEQTNLGYKIKINGDLIFVDDVIALEDEGLFRIEIDGYTIDVEVEDPVMAALGDKVGGSGDVSSPMTGQISNILVNIGDKVEQGETLIIISAMKMENKIIAPTSGTISEIKVAVDDNVKSGALLTIIEPEE